MGLAGWSQWFYHVYPLMCSKLWILDARMGKKRRKKETDPTSVRRYFSPGTSATFWGGGEVADRLSISWRAHKSKETWQKASCPESLISTSATPRVPDLIVALGAERTHLCNTADKRIRLPFPFESVWDCSEGFTDASFRGAPNGVACEYGALSQHVEVAADLI